MPKELKEDEKYELDMFLSTHHEMIREQQNKLADQLNKVFLASLKLHKIPYPKDEQEFKDWIPKNIVAYNSENHLSQFDATRVFLFKKSNGELITLFQVQNTPKIEVDHKTGKVTAEQKYLIVQPQSEV